MTREELNHLSGEIIDACFSVHSELGPGLLESVYEICLAKELLSRGIHFERQVALPVLYKGEQLDAGFRIDFLVGGQIVVELKAVEQLLAVHEAQLLTYLKLANKRLGLLINFNVPVIRKGIKRMVNQF